MVVGWASVQPDADCTVELGLALVVGWASVEPDAASNTSANAITCPDCYFLGPDHQCVSFDIAIAQLGAVAVGSGRHSVRPGSAWNGVSGLGSSLLPVPQDFSQRA